MKKAFILFLLCCMTTTFADSLPHFNLSTQTSSQNPWIADLWLPLYDVDRNYVFANFNGAYSPRKYTRSAEGGGIFRRRLSDWWGLGGYAYLSYNRSLLGGDFFTANPGMEYLDEHWHLSWNAYLPLGATRRGRGNTVWADEVGIYQYITFTNHSQYNQKVRMTSSTGVGTDLIVGYRVPSLDNTKISAGIYYFNMPKHPVGFVALIESPTYKRISFNLGFSHDPLTNNSVTLGVKLHLDGMQASRNEDWMSQPVQHNLPQVTQANTIPISSGYRSQGDILLQKDNIWFFDPLGLAYDIQRGLANCTYEHPCSTLYPLVTQDIALTAQTQNFQNQPSLYLRPGIYTSEFLVLFGNQSLLGRSNDYIFPAARHNLPQIVTSELFISGANDNQSNTVANIALRNNGANFSAISISDAQSVYLDQLQIGEFDAVNMHVNYSTGIFILDSQNVYLSNSKIEVNNYLTGDNTSVFGIDADRVNNLVIKNSSIDSLSNNLTQFTMGIGIRANSTITIQNSRFNQTGTGADSKVINILGFDGVSTNLIVDNSVFTADAAGDQSGAAHFVFSANSVIDINRSTFTANTSSAGTNNDTEGFQLVDNTFLTMRNSTVSNTASSSAGTAASTNFFLYDNSRIELINTNLYAEGQSAGVTGSTNITLLDHARASVTGGTLETYMVGGTAAPGIEPSGAVTIWALNDSSTYVTDAHLIARSGNSSTGAVVIQAQDQSQVSINHSRLNSYYEQGNTTEVASTVVIGAGTSHLDVQESLIWVKTLGVMNTNLSVITAIQNSDITVANSVLRAFNLATPTQPETLKTIGASAMDSGIIYLNSSMVYLVGNGVQLSSTTGNGQVIVTN